jgi:transcriptional regulator with XRE-family HTH domain
MISLSVVATPGLRRQRFLAALTQDQLAEKAGVRVGTIVRLEGGGETRPTTLRRLADALHCEPKDLMQPE